MKQNTIVELKNLSKTIRGKKIIENVNLSLYSGQITGFLGPNGAGKTTTIRMMVGLMKQSGGDVMIDGQSLSADFETAMSKVGVIVENPEMYKFMSGYKNLLHFARMQKGISKEGLTRLFSKWACKIEFTKKYVRIHSGCASALG